MRGVIDLPASRGPELYVRSGASSRLPLLGVVGVSCRAWLIFRPVEDLNHMLGQVRVADCPSSRWWEYHAGVIDLPATRGLESYVRSGASSRLPLLRVVGVSCGAWLIFRPVGDLNHTLGQVRVADCPYSGWWEYHVGRDWSSGQ